MFLNKSQILSWGFITLISIVLVYLTQFFWFQNYYWVSLALIFLLGLSLWVFGRKNNYALRFMYPGLLTFFLFMLIPMFFSIYVGFTNLSTGHFLSKEQVYELLKEETEFLDEDRVFSFELYESYENSYFAYGDPLYLKLKTPGDQFYGVHFKYLKNPPQEIQKLLLTPHEGEGVPKNADSPKNFKKLTPNKVFSLHKYLENFQFYIKGEGPSAQPLKYFRTQYLAAVDKKFEPLDGMRLKDKVTGEIFEADTDNGHFKSSKNILAPGFFVNVGFDNFIKIFKSPEIKGSFFKVAGWTLLWGFFSVLTSFILGISLALLLNDKYFKLKAFYRILLVIPYSIPFFISVLIFKGIMNKDFGAINTILAGIGLPKLAWLSHPILAKISALIVNLWLGFPYMFLLTTGILQSIPESVYEAAKLDGAGRWTTFSKITLPLIMTAIIPLLIGSFAFNLNNFVGIYLLTGGGPPIKNAVTPVGETDILISYTYRLAFEGAGGQDFGLASSISIFIFLFIAALTLINFKISGLMRKSEER